MGHLPHLRLAFPVHPGLRVASIGILNDDCPPEVFLGRHGDGDLPLHPVFTGPDQDFAFDKFEHRFCLFKTSYGKFLLDELGIT